MGFGEMFKRNEVIAPVSAVETSEASEVVDVQAIARKLEVLSDSNLTPQSMARQLLAKEYEKIQKVEDSGERSVLEGKYDAAALKMWIGIIGNNMDTRPLGASLEDDGKTDINEQNIAGVKDFPFFDIESKREAIELAELKQEGWADFVPEKYRLQDREGI